LGYLDKLASSQVNKKEDIDKKRKRMRDVQVSGTLRATQTPANIENLDCDVNLDLSEFQDSLNYVVHEDDSPRVFRSMKGCAIEPSSHTQRRRQFV